MNNETLKEHVRSKKPGYVISCWENEIGMEKLMRVSTSPSTPVALFWKYSKTIQRPLFDVYRKYNIYMH